VLSPRGLGCYSGGRGNAINPQDPENDPENFTPGDNILTPGGNILTPQQNTEQNKEEKESTKEKEESSAQEPVEADLSSEKR
jgi:hypothetical protein